MYQTFTLTAVARARHAALLALLLALAAAAAAMRAVGPDAHKEREGHLRVPRVLGQQQPHLPPPVGRQPAQSARG